MTRTRFPVHHVIRMTLEHCDGVDGGVKVSVATCACGWTHHTKQADYELQDAAVEAHWQAIEAAGQETAWVDLRGQPIDTRTATES